MTAAHDVEQVDFTGEGGRPDAFAGQLDDLLELDAETLAELYEAGRVPQIESLHGDLRGRMLATGVLPRIVESVASRWAASRFFPWGGKSFRPLASSVGRGINRVLFLKLYPFLTTVERSRAGDFDVLQLDYDLPENPFFIRAIKDEMRELRDGLWLGRAYLDVGRTPVFALFFGLTSD